MKEFSLHFWGEKNNGFEVLHQNMKGNILVSKELHHFFQERCVFEDNCAKFFTKLSKQATSPSSNTSYNSFNPVWNIIKQSTEKVSNIHTLLLHSLQEVIKDLHKYIEEQNKRQKQVKEEESATVESIHNIAVAQTNVNKTREVYKQKCQEIEKLRSELVNTPAKELEKGETKYEKAREDHKGSIEKYAEARKTYEKNMGNSCQRFQEFEIYHLTKMKSFVNGYSEILTNTTTSLHQIVDEFKQDVERIDVEKLIDQFVDQRQTGTQKPPVIEFEEIILSSTKSPYRTDVLAQPFQTETREAGECTGKSESPAKNMATAAKQNSTSTPKTYSTRKISPTKQRGVGQKISSKSSSQLPASSATTTTESLQQNEKSRLWFRKHNLRSSKSWFLKAMKKKEKGKKKKDDQQPNNLSAEVSNEKSNNGSQANASTLDSPGDAPVIKTEGNKAKVNFIKNVSSQAIKQPVLVDAEGYSIKPVESNVKSKESSSSNSETESDSDEEDRTNRLKVEIKPLRALSPSQVSMDELKKSVDRLVISPQLTGQGYRTAREARERRRRPLPRCKSEDLDVADDNAQIYATERRKLNGPTPPTSQLTKLFDQGMEPSLTLRATCNATGPAHLVQLQSNACEQSNLGPKKISNTSVTSAYHSALSSIVLGNPTPPEIGMSRGLGHVPTILKPLPTTVYNFGQNANQKTINEKSSAFSRIKTNDFSEKGVLAGSQLYKPQSRAPLVMDFNESLDIFPRPITHNDNNSNNDETMEDDPLSSNATRDSSAFTSRNHSPVSFSSSSLWPTEDEESQPLQPGTPIPLCIWVHEKIGATMSGLKSQAKIFGMLKLLVPLKVRTFLATTPGNHLPSLWLDVKHFENVKLGSINPQIILNAHIKGFDTSSTFPQSFFSFDMGALEKQILNHVENGDEPSRDPNTRQKGKKFIVLDLLKYQVERISPFYFEPPPLGEGNSESGLSGLLPLLLTCSWKHNPTARTVELRINYSLSPRAVQALIKINSLSPTAPISPATGQLYLSEIEIGACLSAPCEAGRIQAKPHSLWDPISKKLYWNLPDMPLFPTTTTATTPSNDSHNNPASHNPSSNTIGSLRAKYEYTQLASPPPRGWDSNPGGPPPAVSYNFESQSVYAKFRCRGLNLTPIAFSLPTDTFTLAAVKNGFSSGKYTCLSQ